MAEGDPPITANDPPRTAPASRPAKTVCGFCECELAPDGGVLRTSERQKTLLRSEEKITDLKAENERLTAKVAELEAKLAPAPAFDAPKKSYGIRS